MPPKKLIQRSGIFYNVIKRVERVFLYILLICGVIIFLSPYIFMVISSFKANNAEIFTYPPRLPVIWHIETYTSLFKENIFGRYFFNTILVSTVTTFLALLVNSLAAYAFARLEFKGKHFLFIFLLTTLMIPFETAMVPLYLLINKFGWLNDYKSLIIPGIANMFSIFFLRQYFQTIPKDLEDAARIDGCSYVGTYFRIIIPLTVPALTAIAILTYLWNWNSFLWPLIVLSKREMYTLQLGIANLQGLYTTQYAAILAASVVASVPMIAIFLALQRYFIQGIVMSGLKG
jgi:multiple sugar transport system permease protein